MHSLYSVFRRIQVRVGAVLARVGILEESRWKRPGSRRGGGGVERGGDACIALGGSTLPRPGRLSPRHILKAEGERPSVGCAMKEQTVPQARVARGARHV